MKKLPFALLAGFAALSFHSVASATIVGTFVPVLQDAATTPPAGFVAQDLSVTTDTDWTQAELVVNLTTGNFNQVDFFGTNGNGEPPSAGTIAAVPGLRWDTYLTGWGALQTWSSAGGAVDIGGSAATFNTTKIDKQWFTTDTSDIGTSTLGRFVASTNASGSWKLLLSSATGTFSLNGQVANGVFVVPEPGTLVLAGLSIPALAFAIRRRRQVA